MKSSRFIDLDLATYCRQFKPLIIVYDLRIFDEARLIPAQFKFENNFQG